MKRLLIVLLASAGVVIAQDFRATLNGVVLDSSGAVVPAAKVEITNAETGEINAVQTLAQGEFKVPFLRPGTYVVSAEAAGFKKLVRKNIVLRVGQTLSVSLTLELGAVTEAVTVTAAPPLLETEKADRGTVIDNARVTEFPINGRNALMLSQLVAGVVWRGSSNRAFDQNSIKRWVINGSPMASSDYLLDGAPNNSKAGLNDVGLMPSVDAVGEFRIHTNSYDAQYGKTGGGIVSITLKSGTNEYHGAVWEFARRGAWAANTFRNNRNGEPKGKYKVDMYGVQLGGPIQFPKIYDGRNRSFFMFSWERYQDDDPRGFTGSVPTLEFLDGDFSKLADAQGRPITIYDPSSGRLVNNFWTRDAFPGNRIPQARINPIARTILGYMPKPTRDAGPNQGYAVNNLFQPGGVNNWTNDFYNLAIKADHTFTPRHKAFFRFATNDRQERKNTNGIMDRPGEAESHTYRVNDAYVIDWVGTLRPTLLVNVRGSYNRFVEGAIDRDNYNFDITKLGFPKDLAARLPNPMYFGVYNYSGYVSQGLDPNVNTTSNFAVHPNLTWIRSAHSLKAGVDMRWIQFANQEVGVQFGLNSTPGFTQKDYLRADPLSGNSIASFLLGAPNSGQADFQAQPLALYKYAAPYIQDDWKITRKLSLNLGLRWDFNLPPVERFNRVNRGFDAAVTNPVDGMVNRTAFPDLGKLRGGLLFAGSGGSPRRPADVYMKAIQPRLGAAYQLTSSMVVRGGWGRYYMNPSNNYILSHGFTYINNAITTLDNGRTPRPGLMSNPFPDGLRLPYGDSQGLLTFLGQSFAFLNPGFRLPYVDHFSFGIQYRLPMESVLDISYVGSRGNDLESTKPINEYDLETRRKCNLAEGGVPSYCDAQLPNPFAGLVPFMGTSHYTSPTLTRANLARPFPHYGGLTGSTRNDEKSWYNSMQITFETRRRGGLNVITTYTLAKHMVRSGYNDLQRDIMQQRLYENDMPHMLSVGAIYTLPVGRGQRFLNSSHRFWSRLLGNWETNAMFMYRSGAPWSLPTNVWYLKDAVLPGADWSAETVRVLRPCVAKWNDNNSITMVPPSVAAGCTDYNFLIMPRYAPTMNSGRDGRLRSEAPPNIDFSLNKTTRITERVGVQFRAEAFNLMNSATRPSWNNNPENPNFGVAFKTDSSGNPRIIQLGIKVLW